MAGPFNGDDYLADQAVDLSDLSYTNQGAKRNLSVKQELVNAIRQGVTAVYGPDYRVEVMSGAQGEGSRGMTGSRRHSTGVAADVWVYSPDGARLTGDALVPLSQHWLASKVGSVGFPGKPKPGHGENSLHLDLVGGTGPGAVPRQKGEGAMWYYGSPTTAQVAALSAGAAGTLPKYNTNPAAVAKGLIPPANIPQVATQLDVKGNDLLRQAVAAAPKPAGLDQQLLARANGALNAPQPMPRRVREASLAPSSTIKMPTTVAEMYAGIPPAKAAAPQVRMPTTVADIYSGIYGQPAAPGKQNRPVAPAGVKANASGAAPKAEELAALFADKGNAPVVTGKTGWAPQGADLAAALATAKPKPQSLSPLGPTAAPTKKVPSSEPPSLWKSIQELNPAWKAPVEVDPLELEKQEKLATMGRYKPKPAAPVAAPVPKFVTRKVQVANPNYVAPKPAAARPSLADQFSGVEATVRGGASTGAPPSSSLPTLLRSGGYLYQQTANGLVNMGRDPNGVGGASRPMDAFERMKANTGGSSDRTPQSLSG